MYKKYIFILYKMKKYLCFKKKQTKIIHTIQDIYNELHYKNQYTNYIKDYCCTHPPGSSSVSCNADKSTSSLDK